jgi:hypothetical protein
MTRTPVWIVMFCKSRRSLRQKATRHAVKAKNEQIKMQIMIFCFLLSLLFLLGFTWLTTFVF